MKILFLFTLFFVSKIGLAQQKTTCDTTSLAAKLATMTVDTSFNLKKLYFASSASGLNHDLAIQPSKCLFVKDKQREVARVDSIGNLIVIDSLATIKALIRFAAPSLKLN